MSFQNGWTVSVQWGYGNYCAAKDYSAMALGEKTKDIHSSLTAEIAVWDASGAWLRIQDHDDVLGHVNADTVAALLSAVAALPSEGSRTNAAYFHNAARFNLSFPMLTPRTENYERDTK